MKNETRKAIILFFKPSKGWRIYIQATAIFLVAFIMAVLIDIIFAGWPPKMYSITARWVTIMIVFLTLATIDK